MRRLLAAAATAALLVPGAAAHAAAASDYRGGCALDRARTAPGDPGTWTAAVYALAVVHSEVTSDNPVSATVTCEVRVDGVRQGDALTFSGTGVVTGAGQVSYVAADDSLVELCETVDFTSDDTPTRTDCDPVSFSPWDPSCVFDVLNQLQRREPPPPAFCEVLQALIGLLPGPTEIDALVCAVTGGDVGVLGELVWDCPPYEGSATAAGQSQYLGGCGFDAVQTTVEAEETAFAGTMYAAALVHSDAAEGNPVTASITCDLRVNDVSQRAETWTGTGVVAGAAPLSYTYRAGDAVTFCETVDFLSDDTPTRSECFWIEASVFSPRGCLAGEMPNPENPIDHLCWFVHEVVRFVTGG